MSPGSFSARLSRRDLLAGVGATLAAAVASPAFAVRRSGAPRIAIVGAGIAGLSAALTLHDRGVPCRIYEAQRRVGGRMHSERAFWGNGQTSEYGAELIDTDHTLMQALAKRFGLHLDDVLAGVPSGEQQTIFERGAYYAEPSLWRDFRSLYPVLREQVAAAGDRKSVV